MGFIDDLEMKTGTDKFINSGVIRRKEMSFEGGKVLLGTHGFREFSRSGDKGYDALLTLNPHYDQPPHLHPGGELAVVLKGMYFDGNMEGEEIEEYGEGATIWYNQFSTHRPLTGSESAHIYYVSFAGIIMKDSPRELIKKAKEIKAPEDALDHMLEWMITNPKERRLLMEEILEESN